MDEFNDLKRRAFSYKWSPLERKTWSDWGLLFRFLVLICKLLSERKLVKRKGKASDWSLFAGKCMSEGKSIKEAAKLWKNHRNK